MSAGRLRLRSEWLRALPPLPPPPPAGRAAQRLLVLVMLAAVGAIFVLLIATEAAPKTHPVGRALYLFHDEVWLRLWAYGWTRYYPWSLAVWTSAGMAAAVGLWVWLSSEPVSRTVHTRLQRRAVRSPRLWTGVVVASRWTQRWRREGVPVLSHTQLRALVAAEWQAALAPFCRGAAAPTPAQGLALLQLTRVRIDLAVTLPLREPEWAQAAGLWHGTVLALEQAGLTPAQMAPLLARGPALAAQWQAALEPAERPEPFGAARLAADFADCVGWRTAGPTARAAAERSAAQRRVALAQARRLQVLERTLAAVAGRRLRGVHARSDALRHLAPEDAAAAPLVITLALDLGGLGADAELPWRTMELMDALALALRLQQRRGTALDGLEALLDGWAGAAPSPLHRRLVADRLERARAVRWHDGDYLAETGFSAAERARQRVTFAQVHAGQRLPLPPS